jgi:hypothetical protein
MSSSSGPSGIMSGLVFDIDMSNTKKSWKGKPTTNIVAGHFDTTFESIALGDAAGWTNQMGTGNYLGVSSNMAYTGTKSLRVNNGTNAGTMQRCYRTFTVNLGDTVSASAWVYSKVAGPWMHLEYFGGNYSWGVAQNYNNHTGSGWEFLWASTTVTATSATTGYYFLHAGPDNVDTYWDNIQVENNSFATQYVNGTRSTSQAIIDLTNNNTIVASSLTYNPDLTTQFVRASSNYISVTNAANLKSNQFTIEMMIYLTSYAAADIVEFGVGSGNYAQWYFRMLNSTSIEWAAFGQNVSNYHDTQLSGTAFTNAFPLNTWLHVVLPTDCASSSSQPMYVNGKQVGASSLNAASTASAWTPADMHIGGWTWNGFTDSKIDNFKFYNKVLTAAEVAQNFNSLRGRYGI